MEKVYTDLSPKQRGVGSCSVVEQSFNSQVRGLIADLEDTVTEAQREIDSLSRVPFSGWDQKRLARQATDVKRAITLLKESILS